MFIPLSGGVGWGPLTRCLAIAYEARRRDHKVVFLCKKNFARIVRQFGYSFRLAPEPKPNGIKPPPFRLSDVAYELGWLDVRYLEHAVAVERSFIRAFRPDIIFTETQFSVPISASLERIPWVAAASWADHPRFSSPLYSKKDTVYGLEAPINRLLQKYNLPKVTDVNELAYLRADMKIAPTIPELQPELRKVPGIEFVGYLLSPELESGELPSEVRRWDKKRPVIYVYMSPGDILPDQWIHTIASAFVHTKFRVFVTLSPLIKQPKSIPNVSNVRFFQRLPGSSAIQKADVVITHGGGNTVINALLYGKPLIVFSHLYAERDYNGHAIERLGAGMNFRTEEFTPTLLYQHIDSILSKPFYRKNAELLQKKIKNLGGSKKTLDLIEELVR